jgi:hypothetical protein
VELFTEATYEQLDQILKLIDNPYVEQRMDYGWMLDWVNGTHKVGIHELINYWEQVAKGER